MINTLLLALFNLRRYQNEYHRVFVVLDCRAAIQPNEFWRVIRPWTWCEITGVVCADVALSSVADVIAGKSATIILFVTQDAVAIQELRATCGATGPIIVDGLLPTEGSREFALFQEVLHHDFELGGLNEWTGSDSSYGSATLRLLSQVHCRTFFPQYAEPYLAKIKTARGTVVLDALDVGCGSVSRLRWGSLNGSLRVTGIDPLNDMYAIVRERHGLSALPSIRCSVELCVPAEELTAHVNPETFDFAYCVNALDHVADPVAAVRAIAHCLRPGGVLAIEVKTREGSRENWWQLHQFDMYVDEREIFMCEDRGGFARPVFDDDARLELREVLVNTADYTQIVAQRV